MATRRILATSGGFLPTDRWGVMAPGGCMTEALRLTGQERPKLTFVLTASGDDRSYVSRTYAAFRGWSVDVSHLELFMMPNVDPEEALLGADVVWVGGGSVANLLALWRLHGVDDLMRQAWESGTVLAGVSAGSICWHVGGPTDSFGPTLRPVTNALGLLPYGNGVHYDSEEQRRPLLHQLVADQVLPLSYATDDGIGILYEGADPVAVVADQPETSGAAYRVERRPDGTVEETRLAPGPIS
jgi:peptidase E